MVKVTIVCLIYSSTKLADWVYESAIKYTPMLRSGEASFLFVANDPSVQLVDHLNLKKYPYLININPRLKDEELFKKGFAKPEYISRVYRGYNRGIVESESDLVVLINSDNFFSPDWLENLMKFYSQDTIICSQLVEPSHRIHALYPGAYRGDFGNTSDTFDEEAFLKFSFKIKKTGLTTSGAYMPCLLHRETAIFAGLYPEGNIAGKSFKDIFITGDKAFFIQLSKIGVKHYTSLDSIVYHLKEGEMDEQSSDLIEWYNQGEYYEPYDSIKRISLEQKYRPPLKYYPNALHIRKKMLEMRSNNFWGLWRNRLKLLLKQATPKVIKDILKRFIIKGP